MSRLLDLVLAPERAANMREVEAAARQALSLSEAAPCCVRILKRSIDARAKAPRIQLKVEVTDGGSFAEIEASPPSYRSVAGRPEVVIVGAGPAGLFAALRCLELGMKPIVLERGKDVRSRRHDLAAITQRHDVNPDSNYCFGEGGAGTYSDGKLYTRSGKRVEIDAVLRLFVAFGASPDILIDAHPHIGTNKLPNIIAAMRNAIREAGGEVHFDARIVSLVRSTQLHEVRLADGRSFAAPRLILATGHSARDVFALLHEGGVRIERKDFALGVRVEHPQHIIDELRYHARERNPHLPPASYSAVEQVEGRGVYSFCMCPGGIIAPCATAPGEVVTNGWSPSKRNNPFANSGVVVEIRGPQGDGGPLSGIDYQRAIEVKAWEAGGRTQIAPAQRMTDFLANRGSASLPACSYRPGVVSHDLRTVLPADVARALRLGLELFAKKMRGYRTEDAIVVAVESRTSSPVRIPRDPQTLQHPDVQGLFPCGEGAGYAGGIVSAAIDGIRCAERACAAAGATI
jgi:uncharacterized protein